MCATPLQITLTLLFVALTIHNNVASFVEVSNHQSSNLFQNSDNFDANNKTNQKEQCHLEKVNLIRLQRLTDDNVVKLVAALIKLDEYKEAQTEFQELKNPVWAIVKISNLLLSNKSNSTTNPEKYEYKTKNLFRLITFIKEIKTNQDKCSLGFALAAVVIQKQTAGIFEIKHEYTIGSLHELGSYLEKHCGDNPFDIKSSLSKDPIEEWTWIWRVQNWYFGSIVSFSRSNGNFHKFYPTLINRTLAGKNFYFDQLTTLNTCLENVHHRAIGWLYFLAEQQAIENKRSENTVLIAHLVKNDLNENGTAIRNNSAALGIYEAVKQRIPEDVSRLVWAKTCVIKHYLTGKHLEREMNENGTDIYLKPGPVNPENLSRATWKVEWYLMFWNDIKQYSLLTRFRSLQGDMPYICMANPDGYDDEKIPVRLCQRGGYMREFEGSWVVNPAVAENGTTTFQLVTYDRKFYSYNLHSVKDEAEKESGNETKLLAMNWGFGSQETHWLLECE